MTDTIAAIATPRGQGAVALLRLSGPQAHPIAQSVLRSRPLTPRRQTLRRIFDRHGEVVDEVLATFFPGPGSYTGEDLVEISCHGGLLLPQTILLILLDAGARAAEPGEFTQRAFLHGKMDLTQAEAVMDLISAQTSLAQRTALAQLRGSLGRKIEALRQDLLHSIAHLEAHIDFPDEDISPDTGSLLAQRLRSLTRDIELLAASATQGRILREGVRTVICGQPNAGKSSLLNQLSGYDRAIVASQPGTTRDTIEESINLRGIPLRLVDTAGLRDSTDPIEIEGISRSTREIAEAELVIEILDGHLPPAPQPPAVSIPPGTLHLRVLNKADLGIHPAWADSPSPTPAISCVTGKGLDELKNHIFEALFHQNPAHSHPGIAVNSRHLHALTSCQSHLDTALLGLEQRSPPEFIAVDLRSALHALDAILGKTDVEEILSEIFRTFCLGK